VAAHRLAGKPVHNHAAPACMITLRLHEFVMKAQLALAIILDAQQ
jgi:hypothetical protein